MDNLSINIFVPESKLASKGVTKKQKTSEPPPAKLTVVKSSPKLPNSPIRSKNISVAINAKKSPIIKANVGKHVVSKPFLLSEKFNRNDLNTNSVTVNNNEKSSLSFVKPNLFPKNAEPTRNRLWSSAKPSPRQVRSANDQKSPVNKQDEPSERLNASVEFTVNFVKPKLFQKKPGASKEKSTAQKRDRMSHNADGGFSEERKSAEQRNVSVKTVKNSTDKISEPNHETKEASGGFTVDFVEPKLFQKKRGSSKDAKTAKKWDKMILKADGKDKKSADLDNEIVDLDEDFSVGFSSDSRGQKSFKNRGSALFEEGAWKSDKSTNKWFSNVNKSDTSDQSGRIQVDFSMKSPSAGNVSKKTDKGVKRTGKLKRKFEDEIKDGEKKRRKDDFGGKEPQKSAGPASSLFSYDSAVEPLEDTNVEPWEERLFSRKTFKDAGVHPHLVGNLEQLFGITNMTVVQKKSLPELMSGKDCLVRSQTGSGKTLAYAIPIMHSLQEINPKLTRKDGVKALIVLPTRELALQTYECFTKLMRAFTWIVPGIFIGGEKRKSEKVRLRKGITVLIGTPGRLLDHAEHSENLTLHGIDWLIIDEADKLLEMGYEKDISQLMSIIDSQREKAETVGRKQTVLLSATLTSAVEKLANLALKKPVHVDACNNIQETIDVMVIPQSLEQKYVVVPAKMRLVALASFIIEVTELRKSNKVLVFMATQDMVDFYLDLIPSVLSSTVKFFKLHGNMSQGDRTEVFNTFRKSDKGVLLSTDVAARGLDLPQVDWIVQYTAPTTPAEYVHRVGRTARVGSTGSSLLFLLPSELHFVSMLNSSRIKLDEVNIDVYLKCLMKIHLESRDGQRWGGGIEGAATVLQHNFEHAILEDKTLHDIACKAYKSWVRFYATYPKDLRVVFDFKSLHLGHNAKSFALRDAPRAIGGIGKPQKAEKWGKGTDMRPIRKRKNDKLGHVTESSRTKKLILSEFDSGLKHTKKTY